MKNELLHWRDCLKYREKYGRNTLLYPLALRSSTEVLPRLLRPERLSAARFSYPSKAVPNNRAFLQLAQSPPWDFGTVRVKSSWSKTTLILQGGEKKGSVCLQLVPALGSLHKPGFVKMSDCQDGFSSSNFSLFLGEERTEKFTRKLKLWK